MNFETSKILGGIGAMLLFVGIFPVINTYMAVPLVGVALILIGLYGLSAYYRDRLIFTNAVMGVGVGAVGAVVGVAVLLTVVLSSVVDLLKAIYPGWNGDWATLQSMTLNTIDIDFSAILPLLSSLLIVAVVSWIATIIASFFIRRSMIRVSSKSQVGLFATIGLLLIIGAVLTIVAVGFILMWVTALLLAIAFFTLKPQPPQETYTAAHPSTQQPTTS